MQAVTPKNLFRHLAASESRITRLSLALGVISMLLLVSLVGVGIVRQAQLSENIAATAETGRIIVQLQRETLRLLALVKADPEVFDAEAVDLQRSLLESRFNVVGQAVTRSFLPADILTRVEAIEERWADLQPELDDWQEHPDDEDLQAHVSTELTELERAMNEAEINFARQRITSISGIARDSQSWLLALGLTSVLIIVLIGFMANYLFQITRRQQEAAAAEAAARESNRLKSEFLATMSHELRTPLNGVIGYADFLMSAMSQDLNSKQLDYLQRILSNGERLLRLVDDILDVSRIEAGRLELIPAAYSPADLLDSLKPDLLAMGAKKGLEINVIADPSLPAQLIGDRQRLAQIVTNLTWNAVKFTEEGHIDVSFKRTDPTRWSIIVTDTGIGIPAHAQEFIFEKFRQADGTLERKQGGAGLGLHIVRNLAVLMGGSVRVQSEVDHGSTFTIDLPIQTPELAKAA